MNDKVKSSKEPRSGSKDPVKGGSSPEGIIEDMVPPGLTVFEVKSKGSKTRFGYISQRTSTKVKCALLKKNSLVI